MERVRGEKKVKIEGSAKAVYRSCPIRSWYYLFVGHLETRKGVLVRGEILKH